MNCAFHNESEIVWYFFGVYIVKKTLHGHLETQNFSPCVTLHSLVKIFSTLKEKFPNVSLGSHVISSIFSHYRGGKICMTDHFKPLWGRNVPKFGIAHAMALGVSVCLQCAEQTNLHWIRPSLKETSYNLRIECFIHVKSQF